MSSSALKEIEDRLPALSRQERLELIETVARSLREPSVEAPGSWITELHEMAADPQIQQEIRCIDQEFASTHLDGLDAA